MEVHDLMGSEQRVITITQRDEKIPDDAFDVFLRVSAGREPRRAR
jgi:hypothetical protein